MTKIGLVAGEGRLPVVFAKEAKARGDEVVGFGLIGLTSKELDGLVDRMHWFKWGELQKALFALVTERVKKIILLGKIKKTLLLKDEKALDEKARGLMNGLKDRKDYSILNTVAALLGKMGIELIDVASYLGDLMPARGVLTARKPTEEETKNIEVGRLIVSKLAEFDAGQAACVKDGCAIALEGAEGTDDTIRRAGLLTDGGFTVVKMARPNQDLRLDVPLVGLDTLKTLIDAKGTCLALEAKKTLLMDREDLITLADKSNICIAII